MLCRIELTIAWGLADAQQQRRHRQRPGLQPAHVQQVVHQAREPVAPRRLNPAIPRDLETVVQKLGKV